MEIDEVSMSKPGTMRGNGGEGMRDESMRKQVVKLGKGWSRRAMKREKCSNYNFYYIIIPKFERQIMEREVDIVHMYEVFKN